MTSVVSAAQERTEKFKRRMITASVMMATTVVIIDMTIATIALPHMQGGLSASQDQISWVMTTYFMMQAVREGSECQPMILFSEWIRLFDKNSSFHNFCVGWFVS